MRTKNSYVAAVAAAVSAVVFSALPLAFTLVLALSGAAHADTLYWDNSGGIPNSWNSVPNWSTVVGGGTNPSAIPGSSDVATFSATPIQGTNQTINLNGGQSVLGLNVLSGVSATTTFASGGTAQTLTIGSSGITNAGSGVVAIGNASGGGASVNVTFAGSQSIANNGSGSIRIFNTVGGTGSPTITNNGTGTATVSFSNVINSTVSKFVQDSATSMLSFRGTSASTGGVEVKKGTLNFGNNAANLGTGTVTLGNVAGGSDAATLEVTDNTSQSFANAIVLASTTTGPLTIRLTEDSIPISHSKTFTGGITGSNSLTIQNNGGNDTINFTTNAIDNAGTLTHTGTGTGLTTINSVIGSNVTGVTQNSASSTLVLGGTNLYSGPTTVSSGALRLANQNAVQNSTVTMGGGAGAALVFSSTVVGNAFTLGGLAASSAGAGYNISLLNDAGSPAPIALTVGGNNASTTYAGVLSGTGGSLIKSGTGTLALTGTSTYTGATTVNAGSLLVNGGLGNTAVTVNSGGLLGGNGSILGGVSVLAGGTFSPGTTGPGLISVGSLGLAGTTLMDITGTSRGSSYDAADVTGGLTYGGSMLIDFGPGALTALPDNTVFNLFKFGSRTGTFSSITTVNDGSVYGNLTLTGTGDVWTSTSLVNGQFLQFTHSLGNLVIVPEPSTIGMLIGVAFATAGWRLRRLKKSTTGC
jgi:autotransporter-associated beta strand protein